MAMEQEIATVGQRLEEMLTGNALQEAVDLLASVHPADQADLYLSLGTPEFRETFLSLLSAEGQARLLEHLDEEERGQIIERMPRASLARVLDRMENDEAVDILQELPPAEMARVLSNMTTASEIAPLLEHREESAGGLMTRGYVALHKDMTAREATTFLRLRRPFAEEAYYLYVLDAANRLQGVVNLRQLIVADPDTRIEAIMTPEVISVAPETDQEECARLIQHYRLRALPVVDEEDVLRGIITADDLMDVVRAEATEDMYRMVGLDVRESALSPVTTALRRRAPWLLVNLMTAFIAALTVRFFEDTISKVATLAVFMPVIAGHAGNTGTQVTTLVVRSLALGEVTLGDTMQIVGKEVVFGLAHGLIVGLLTAGLALSLSHNGWLAGIVLIAMLGNVIVAGVFGTLIPLGFRAVKMDPALASAIWLTTFTDVIGFLMLLGTGTLLVSKLT